MRALMRNDGFDLRCEDDSADYAKRFSRLADGELDFAVATVDAYLLGGAAQDFPGAIVAVIDESKGGDAIIAIKSRVPTLDALKTIAEELLFLLRQRIQDLQQQLVNQQGYLTTELVIRNNKELIRGVNCATQVMVNALQVAVTLALALANQKIVLDKLKAVNTTTENLIASTAERLKTQGAEIHKQASSTQLDVEVLKKAFDYIRAALDDISRYRQEAFPKMAPEYFGNGGLVRSLRAGNS